MPISFRFLREHKLICTRFHGELLEADFRAYNLNLRRDKDFTNDMNELVILDSIQPRLTAEELYAYKIWLGALPPIARTAIVAARDFEFGMARMFEQTEGGPTEIAVFRSQSAALHWLGLPEHLLAD